MKHLLRIAIGLIGIILIFDAVVLVVRGVMETWHAYRDFFTGAPVERPLLPALEAVDMFFMALAFFIVAVGLVQLFVGDLPWLRTDHLTWLRIDSFGQLKLLLWDTFLVTIMVLFVTRLISTHELDWDLLVLPAAILMLTISSFLLKSKH